MTLAEFIVVLGASPLVAALIYGSWKFSSETRAENPKQRPVSFRADRYRTLRKAVSA